MEKISQNRLKMAKIDNFSNEIQLSLNHIQSKIFEILGVQGVPKKTLLSEMGEVRIFLNTASCHMDKINRI